MNALLRGGPWDGKLCPGLHGGDRLERTGGKADDRWLLAVYERTGETVTVELEHATREGVVRKPGVADVFAFAGIREVLKDTRLVPGEQMALAV